MSMSVVLFFDVRHLGLSFSYVRIISELGAMRAQCSDDNVTWREMPGVEAPSASGPADVRALFEMMREFRVTKYVTPSITVEMPLPPTVTSAPAAAPTTPEQPGNKATPTKGDIFDVLQSGVIPGAPVVEPTISSG